MFDLLNAKLISNAEEVELVRPNEIAILEDGEDKPAVYLIEKGAAKFLYKQLGISQSTSKELYKNNREIWKTFIESQLEGKDGKRAPFKFTDSNVRYMVDNNGSLVDMTIMSDSYFEDLQSKLDIFTMEVGSLEHTRKFYFEGSNGLVKLIIYDAEADIVEDKYTPVVILEVNNKKAEYSVYTGIIIYDSFTTFIPSMNPVVTYQSYIDFIMGVNILGTLDMSKEKSEDLYNAYLDFKSSHVEISLREVIRILTKVGYKLDVKEDATLDDISNLNDEEANIVLKNFFNSFKTKTGESAEDLLNLSEIRKIFRYNKLTIVELLEILSKQYISEDGAKITAQILSDLVFGLYTKKTDSIDAKGIIDDINN